MANGRVPWNGTDVTAAVSARARPFIRAVCTCASCRGGEDRGSGGGIKECSRSDSNNPQVSLEEGLY